MATRIYFSSATTATPISPTPSAAWSKTAGFQRRIAQYGTGDGSTLTNTGTFTGTGTNPNSVCARQFIVTTPLAAQTITGTVKGQQRPSESNAALNAQSQMTIRVIAPDGTTVRGTLLALDASGASSEWVVTTQTNRKMPLAAISPVTLTSVAAQAGDYLVIEQGAQILSTDTSSTFNMRFGSSGASDLPEDETDTGAKNPWLEFSANLSFNVGVGAVTLPALTTAGTGSEEFSGTGAVSLAATTVDGSGAESVTGTGAVTLAAATVAGAGTETLTGTGAVSLASTTVAGTGAETFSGTGAVSLAAATVAGVGSETFPGTGAVTLSAVTVDGSGSETFSGTGAVTLPAITIAGSGTATGGTPAPAPAPVGGSPGGGIGGGIHWREPGPARARREHAQRIALLRRQQVLVEAHKPSEPRRKPPTVYLVILDEEDERLARLLLGLPLEAFVEA